MGDSNTEPTSGDRIDLEDFETRIVIRPLRIEDFDRLISLQGRCFPGMPKWAKDQVESQLQRFPEGQIVIELDEELIASSSSLIVDFGRYESWHDWKVVSDSGYIRNHDADGDTLYGIEVMVDPQFRGLKIARRLYEARKQIARHLNLRRIIVAGRIPGYRGHSERMSASEYCDAVISRKLFDPVLTVQMSNGFVLKGLIPNYLPSDLESMGFATFLEWTNLDYVRSSKDSIQTVKRVRLCLVQYMMRRVAEFGDFAKQCESIVDVGSDYKSDFVVFPELHTTQLMCLVSSQRAADAARELAEFTPAYLELFNQLSIKYNVNIVGGSQLVSEDDKLYNVSYLFRRDGTIERQYKIHITPNEAKWWGVSPGSRVEVFDTDCGKIAILICYDIEFPELSRIAVARGAKILFVPFNTDERYGYLRVRHCAQARAIENQVYVAIAGCAGMMPLVQNADMHYAQCAILTPSDFPFARDAVASESMPNIETVVVHDVDLELLRRNRVDGTARPYTDRRTDLYRILYHDPDRGEVQI